MLSRKSSYILAAALGLSVALSAESLPFIAPPVLPALTSLFPIHLSRPFFGTYPKLLAVQTLALPALALLVLMLPASRRISWWIKGLGVFLLWAAASLLWSDWPPGTAAYLAQAVPNCILAALAFHMASDRAAVFRLVRLFLVALVLASALQLAVLLNYWVETGRRFGLQYCFFVRPIPFGNCNFATPHLIFGLSLLVSFAAWEVRRLIRGRGGRRRAILLGHVVAALLAAGLLAFLVRTAGALAATVAVVVSVVCYALAVSPIRNKKLALLIPIAAGLAGGLVLLGVPALRHRCVAWALRTDSTAQVRVVGGLAAADMTLSRPFRGWGAGTFVATYPRFEPAGARALKFVRAGFYSHPHSEPLRVASELGLPGLLMFLTLTVGVLFGAADRIARMPLKARLIGWALWTGLIGYLTETAFDVGLSYWDVAPTFWILCGTVAGYGREPQAVTHAGMRRRIRARLPWLALAVALGLWGWWVYGVGGYRSQMQLRQVAVLFGQGRPDEMRRKVDAARINCVTPGMILRERYRCASLYLGQGRHLEASEQLAAILKVAPEFLDSRRLLALCYYRLREYPEALKQILQFIQRRPENAEGLSLAAEILLKVSPTRFAGDIEHCLMRACELSHYERGRDARRLVEFLVGRGEFGKADAFIEQVRKAGHPYWADLKKLRDRAGP